MLIGGVVDDQLDEHLDLALVRRADECSEVVERAVARMHAQVVGDVVAVVFERRGKERQQPEAGDAEALQIVELLGQAREIADAVVVAVEERLDVRLVDDRVLVPERVVAGRDAVDVLDDVDAHRSPHSAVSRAPGSHRVGGRCAAARAAAASTFSTATDRPCSG